MASRSDEVQKKEHQAEEWEEMLLQRSEGLAESARMLAQKRAGLTQLLSELRAASLPPLEGCQDLLRADPLLASPHVAAAQQQAIETRKVAVEARQKAAQLWEEDLSRQVTAMNNLLQNLAQMQAQGQSLLREAVRREQERRDETARQQAAATAAAAAPVPLLNGRAYVPEPVALQAKNSHASRGAERRVLSRVTVQVQVDFESDHNFFTGFSSDISEGGLFVATVNVQPLGAPIEVAFALPTGEQVVARGQVRWVREINDRAPSQFPGMGIRFESLSEEARDAVHRFIGQREPIFYDD